MVRKQRRFGRKPRLELAGYVVLVACVFAFSLLKDRSQRREEEEPSSKRNPGAVAAASADWKNPQNCRSCHEEVFREWEDSHHALANRSWDSEADAEAFAVDSVTDEAGLRHRIGLRGGEPTITELLSGGGERSAVAKGVIGATPFRQYLVEGTRGRLQAHSLAWDPEAGEWFGVFGDERREAGEWGHWTGQGMNWNSNCAWCHMTEYDKNYDPQTDSYDSSWTHQGISCIACHSGLEDHAASVARGDYVVPEKPESSAVMSNCASCHSRREELTDGAFVAGDVYEDHYRLTLYDHPAAYFPDGKANEENFVFGSFQHSAMGHAGVSCLDCHHPHSNELILPVENNALCIQCHSTGRLGATLIEPQAHSRHAAGTPGGSCVDCHMPRRTYMARDDRRDHGFTTPDPYMTVEYGTPTACVNCHQEQGAEWALERFEEWFGDSERVLDLRKRASLLHRAWSGELESPEELLERLSGEPNPYWQASLLRLLRPFAQTDEVATAAEPFLASPQPVVRAAALYALGEREDKLQALRSGLKDPIRVARLEALDTLSTSEFATPRLREEWRSYLEANADRPAGALQLSALAASEGDRSEARRLSELAVTFDRSNPALRYDVAIMLDRVGFPEDALRHLRIAQSQDPQGGLYWFAAGLVQGGQGDLAAAARSLVRAVRLDHDQDRWWYNLAIVQARLGSLEEARRSLERALELSPGEASYRSFLDGMSEPQTSPPPSPRPE